MKMLLAAAAFAALVASPAFAQSYDPDVGSGNIAPRADAANYLRRPVYQGYYGAGAFAQVPTFAGQANWWPKYNAVGVDRNASHDD